jgi:regulatory protein SWI5
MHQHQQQRHGVSHRRGMSLDTRRQQMHSPTTIRQEFTTVSNGTNTGINTPQHVLRETQQQRIARPGPQQQQQPQHAYANLASDENYLMSPHGTPQMQGFDGRRFDGLPGPAQTVELPYDMYNGPMNHLIKKNQEHCSENNMNPSQDFDLFPPSNLSTPTFMTFQESPAGASGWISEGDTSSTRRNSRRISNGIMDRVTKFENLGEAQPRPLTPPQQNATGEPLQISSF